jgi:hypothetical protein
MTELATEKRLVVLEQQAQNAPLQALRPERSSIALACSSVSLVMASPFAL